MLGRPKTRLHRRVAVLACALAVVAGCAGVDSTAVSIEAGENLGLGASDGSGTDETNTDDAARFAPVDPQPAVPTSMPYPTPTPYEDVAAPVAVPDGLSNPPAIPGPPPPTMFGGENECPGVIFENPALFVWGTDLDGSTGGLWVRDEPAIDAPTQRLLARNALAQFMTAGCKLGADGTPWFEFGSSSGQIGYANSRFIVQAHPACLTAEVATQLDGERTETLAKGTFGHAYADGGELAGFIPNEDIGSVDLYSLVPSDSVLITPASNQVVPPCEPRTGGDMSATSSSVRLFEAACDVGPAGIAGSPRFVDLDRLSPLDAIVPVVTESIVGDEQPSTTWNVYVGAVDPSGDDNQCTWQLVGDLRDGGIRNGEVVFADQHWSCTDDGGGTAVKLFQFVIPRDPAIGARLIEFEFDGSNLNRVGDAPFPPTPVPTSTCAFFPSPQG